MKVQTHAHAHKCTCKPTHTHSVTHQNTHKHTPSHRHMPIFKPTESMTHVDIHTLGD